MIPVADSVHSRTFPFVNLGLILANVGIFIYELSLGAGELDRYLFQHGVIPVQLIDWLQDPSGLEVPGTVLTALFLHGGWLHLGGNMLFLWVFGDNVEDALGHLRYLIFYLLAGVGAVALQVFVDQDGTIPMIGASGAIAGVLGAYLVLYPRASVAVVIPWFWFFGAFPLPAATLIVIWFLLQLLNGIAAIGGTAVGVSSGIAFWAHVGGFLSGFLIVLLLRPLIPRRARSPRSRPRDVDLW